MLPKNLLTSVREFWLLHMLINIIFFLFKFCSSSACVMASPVILICICLIMNKIYVFFLYALALGYHIWELSFQVFWTFFVFLMFPYFFKDLNLFILESASWVEQKEEREGQDSQAVSALSTGPHAGLDQMTLPSWSEPNQEWDI